MFRNRERGMSYWPFVVTLVLFLVALFAWYQETGISAKANDRAAQAEAERDARRAKEQEWNNKLLDLAEVIGWTDAAGHPDKALIEAGMADLMTKAREQMVLEFSTSKFSATGAGGKLEEVNQPPYKVRYLPTAAEMSSTPKVEEIGPLFLGGIGRMSVDIAHHTQLKSEAEAARDSAIAAHAAALSGKDTRITDQKTQLDALQANLDEQGSELRDQIDSLKTRAESVQTQMEEAVATAEKTEAELANKLAQAQGETRRLNDREEPFLHEGPDGEVLAAANGIAVINRGKKDMLMPGTNFVIKRRVKGGDLVPIGVVKVTNVGDETSRGQIIEASDVIAAGDLIESDIYSPNRQLHFVLIGEFKRMGKSTIEARLESLGAAIDEAVEPTTHYLVVGTSMDGAIEDTDAYRRARDFGIPRITEDQLASMTRL